MSRRSITVFFAVALILLVLNIQAQEDIINSTSGSMIEDSESTMSEASTVSTLSEMTISSMEENTTAEITTSTFPSIENNGIVYKSCNFILVFFMCWLLLL